MIQSLERGRAESAVVSITSHIRKFNPDDKAEELFWDAYCGITNDLRMQIRTQGLLRAFAAEIAAASKISVDKARKEKLGRLCVLDDICTGLVAWHELTELEAFTSLVEAIKATGGHDLQRIETRVCAFVEPAIRLKFEAYTVLQREVLEILSWLKNLSEPYGPKSRTGEGEEGEAEQQEAVAAGEFSE